MKVWRHPLTIKNRALLETHMGLEAQIPTVQKAPMPEAQKRQWGQVKKIVSGVKISEKKKKKSREFSLNFHGVPPSFQFGKKVFSFFVRYPVRLLVTSNNQQYHLL